MQGSGIVDFVLLLLFFVVLSLTTPNRGLQALTHPVVCSTSSESVAGKNPINLLTLIRNSPTGNKSPRKPLLPTKAPRPLKRPREMMVMMIRGR
jgi:hypothetical protein